MKIITQRGLSLSVNYTLIGKKYIPLEQSIGAYCCDNCGKLIANIATVKSINGTFNIGFDCLETILINNQLLSGCDIQEYERVKKMIPKVLRFAKTIKETASKHNITGLFFEPKMFASDSFFTFYWLVDNQETSRNNDYVKLKDMDFDFLIDTLKNIFPKINFKTA